MKKKKLYIICIICQTKRYIPPSQSKARYCSQKCATIDRTGREREKPKLLNARCIICGDDFKYYASTVSGKYCNIKCVNKDRSRFTKEQFKTGSRRMNMPNPGWAKGLRRPELSGENHYGWKGDDVGYTGLHEWVKRNLVKPQTCRDCNLPKKLELANISQKYLRELSDWEWLCRSCHMKKDGRMEKLNNFPMTESRKKNISIALKKRNNENP